MVYGDRGDPRHAEPAATHADDYGFARARGRERDLVTTGRQDDALGSVWRFPITQVRPAEVAQPVRQLGAVDGHDLGAARGGSRAVEHPVVGEGEAAHE